MPRVALGALILLLFAAAAAGGVWLLYHSEGGGLPFSVSFADARGLEPGARVVYRDQMVGRVVAVRTRDGRAEAEARLSSEHAGLLREGSRFWVQESLGGAFLCFDTPPRAGAELAAGARLWGLEARPEPEAVEAKPRKLEARPAWLCEVRVSATVRESGELVRDERRKAAAAVVRRVDRAVWVLAPAWVAEGFQGEVLSRGVFVEFAGGETCVAAPEKTSGGLALLKVEETNYSGGVAELWAAPLASGQPLVLANADAQWWVGELADGTLKTGAALNAGCAALVDGVKLCGFALPVAGERVGARWVPLLGVDALID